MNQTKINKKISARKVLENTGRNLWYIDEEVLQNCPKNKGNRVVEFFNFDYDPTAQQVQDEYDKRGLIPADIWEITSVEDPYNYYATQWKNKKGEWCFASFSCEASERFVIVDRYDGQWCRRYRFGGVRKLALGASKISSLKPQSSVLPDTLIINGIE